MNLFQLTVLLLDECAKCRPRHTQMREEDREPDFFQEVKPYADEVHALIARWKEEMARWIAEARPKHVRMPQVENAADMMTQFIVQSFYKGTGKKRFYQSIQSVQYTLKIILEAMKEGEADDPAEKTQDDQ
ncbi:YppE family protein [Bhargavaea ullalensis]|uniref:Uncharacterized protein n=1 Tax=Bhargavaea ullalensis TaxID=1265685 RepID=A0ABV2GA62_9BACL